MADSGNLKFTSSHLDCLSLLEGNTAVLYTALADRVTLFSAKSILLEAAADSQKHSMLLRDAGEKLAKTNAKSKGYGKIDEVFNVTYKIYKEIIAKEEISPEETLALAEKLSILEKILGEKYLFMQERTQKLKEKQLNPLQKVSLDNLGSLFARLINDGVHHRELLRTVMGLVEKTLQKEDDIELASFVATDSLAPSQK